MAQVLSQMGLATGLQQKVQGVVLDIQAEEANILEAKRIQTEQDQAAEAPQGTVNW